MSSRVWPWEYDDRNKRTLRVAPSPGEDDAADVQTASGHVVAVEAAGLPGFIAALYAAAGKPEPVILERPGIDTGSETGVNLLRVSLQPGKGVNIGTANSSACIAPPVARHLASVLAAYADAAEADEPDPDQVRELAAELHRTHCDTADCMLSPTIGDIDSARAALRWIKGRQP